MRHPVWRSQNISLTSSQKRVANFALMGFNEVRKRMETEHKDQKYKIVKKLDSGGMAEVFLAEMETVKGFKKTVAIKRIRPNLIKEERFVKMFMDEARLSLYLQHANIASVFDVGMSDKHFFIVMEYVEGLNLRSILELRQEYQLPAPVAVYIVLNVCEALHYAHTLKDSATWTPFNIVHRDISPPNVLISKRGEIKLVDFGLAKAASQDEESEPGVIKGKYSYLSPEAAAGLEVDHRTDIFASGIILFELLTGRRLFLGENNYETVLQVKEAQIPPLSQVIPNAPPELERILAKTLQRDPEKRYMSASNLGDDLTKLLFKMGEAVTKRDIARYVIEALEIKKKQEPSMLISRDSLLKEFIEEEINQLISVGAMDGDAAALGAAPIDLDGLAGADLLKTEHESEPLLNLSDGPSSDSQPLSLEISAPGVPSTSPSEGRDRKVIGAQKEGSGPVTVKDPGHATPSVDYRASSPTSFVREDAPEESGGLLKWILIGLLLIGIAAGAFFMITR